MRFFDFLFYRLYWWNTKIVLDFSPVFSAILGLSVIQGLNLVFILELLSIGKLSFAENILNNYLLVVGIIPLLLNLFYYIKNKRYLEIISKCKSITVKERKRKDYICIAYIVLSFILVVLTLINARSNLS
jgi:hypothetical protein